MLKYLFVGCNGSGAASGLVVEDDEGLPRAVTAAINQTGLTQDCNGGDWCDVSVQLERRNASNHSSGE